MLFGREDLHLSKPIIRILLSNGLPMGLLNTVPAVLCGVIELVARIVVSAVSVLAPIPDDTKLWILYFAGPAAWVGATVFLMILLPRSFKKMEQCHGKEQTLADQLDEKQKAESTV